MSAPTPPLLASGYFGPTGDPRLKVKLGGVFNPTGIELEAIIDTGFSGFLSIPLLQAFPIGLPLYGTTTVQFADGSTGNKLTAMGTLMVGSVQRTGVVILQETQADALLGMDFIRRFNVALVMTKSAIALLDHDWWDKTIMSATPTSGDAGTPTLPDRTSGDPGGGVIGG
jgi:predicted aspartyl protease